MSSGKVLLSSGIPVPKKETKGNILPFPVKGVLHPGGLNPQHLSDCMSLSAGALRAKYIDTYTAWRNMKSRAKQGAIINQSLADFRDFLRILGPRTNKNYTLDRLNNADPEYAPGKVEWRDKYAQNSNKGNNAVISDSAGEKHTVAQWAAITKEKANTIYKRLANGWSEHEAIHGRSSALVADKWRDTPWPIGREEALEAHWLASRDDSGTVSREEYLYRLAETQLRDATAISLRLKEREIDLDCGSDYGSVSALEDVKKIQQERKLVNQLLARTHAVKASAAKHLLYARQLATLKEDGRAAVKRFSAVRPRPPRLPPSTVT